MSSTERTWVRIAGPAETYDCGDVEYEIGSTYASGLKRATINYFVYQHDDDGPYTVEWRCESWRVDGDEQPIDGSEWVTYDCAETVGFATLAEAVTSVDLHAAVDESWIFNRMNVPHDERIDRVFLHYTNRY